MYKNGFGINNLQMLIRYEIQTNKQTISNFRLMILPTTQNFK